MPTPILLRPATHADGDVLEAMLLAAFAWNPESEPATVDELRTRPEVWHYVDGWMRSTDVGVIATDADGAALGAAWARRFSAAEPGYGYVDDSIPELSMGVDPDHRGRGVGGLLLDGVIAAAGEAGAPGVSLSVEDGNAVARRLYESRGFAVVGREGDSDVMLLALR